MMDRRKALDGAVPRRVVTIKRPLELPKADVFGEFDTGSGKQEVSTTMAFTRLLRNLARDKKFGPRVVPIIPDEARTFGMDALFREFKIYASQGQKYDPVDAQLLLSYTESKDGQLLEEGITEAGSMSSFTAAGTAYATRGVPMVPFFIFYSMFGFQRVGDLLWAAADARARGFLLGATAGRTTLLGEGLQHQDGHSHLLASAVPSCEAYDPAFAYEMAAIIRTGSTACTATDAHCRRDNAVFYYLTLYNENYVQPPKPDAKRHRRRDRARPVQVGRRAQGPEAARRRSCSPAPRKAPPGRRRPTSPSTSTWLPSCGRRPRTRSCAKKRCQPNGGTGCTRATSPDAVRVDESLRRRRARSSPSPTT